MTSPRRSSKDHDLRRSGLLYMGCRKARNRYCFGEIASDVLGPETIQEVENVDLYMGLDLCGGLDNGEAV